MAITSVLIILSASLIAIAATSISTTSSSVNSRQAYLNVRSALEYAYAYYCDSGAVPKLADVHDEYMVMLDVDGGTPLSGAKLSTQADAANYTTYVVANYEPPSTPKGSAVLKLTAYSKSADVLGRRGSQMVHLTARHSVATMGNKNRVTLTDIDMDTSMFNYDPPRDTIAMHIKQYPGQNWTPFYYVWTYKDQAEMYAHTDNCYGTEVLYKNNTNVVGSSITYYKGDGSKACIFDGMNYNESDVSLSKNMTVWNINSKKSETKYMTFQNNKIEPASIWNVLPNASDPRNGTTSYFSRRGNGWFDATYYIRNDQVNYFNLIITAKGKVLNDNSGHLNTDNVQTNEMFHLWYLNSADRNIYFEFLKPGMKYYTKSTWNGLTGLNDRMLVYVKNQKTALHFKIKGIGDTVAEANTAPTKAPVISEVSIGGVPIFQDDGTYNNFKNAFSDAYYNSAKLEANFNNNFYKTGNNMSYFYGNSQEGEKTMMYEGCGWWVANIATERTFLATFDYYDKSGNAYNDTLSVTPSSNDDAWVVAIINPAGRKRTMIYSQLTEAQANDTIGADSDAYVTVHVRSSEVGTPVAPYIDYQEAEVSSAERRELLNKIIEGQGYSPADYEPASFAALTTAIEEGVTLYNDVNYIQKEKAKGRSLEGAGGINEDFVKKTKAITDAINGLRTIQVDEKTYNELVALIQKGDGYVQQQSKNHIFDSIAFQTFNADTGWYKKCKAEEPTILTKTGAEAYSTTMVQELIDHLDTAITALEAAMLDKVDFLDALATAKAMTTNSFYKADARDELAFVVEDAETLNKRDASQTEIDEMTTNLLLAIDECKKHPNRSDLDTAELVALIAQANELLNATPKANCTDVTYNLLSTAKKNADDALIKTEVTQAELDAAEAALQTAIDGFTVYKPGYGEGADENSVTMDKLDSQDTIRVWLYGFNTAQSIPGYYDKDGVFKTKIDDMAGWTGDRYQIENLSILLYIDGNYTNTVLNASEITEIKSQNLAYFDMPKTDANGYQINLRVRHQILGAYDVSSGDYTVLKSEVIPYLQENVSTIHSNGTAIVFDKINRIVSTNTGGGEKVTNTLSVHTNKISIMYLDEPNSVSTIVKTYDESGIPSFVNTVSEGHYQVARFLAEANQSLQIKYFDAATSKVSLSRVYDSDQDKYFNTFTTLTDKEYIITRTGNTAQENSMRMVKADYDIPDLAGSAVTKAEIIIKNGATTDTKEMYFDGQYFQVEIIKDYPNTASFQIKRTYVSSGVTRYVSSTALTMDKLPKGKETYAKYTALKTITPQNSATAILRADISFTAVTNVYPKYSSSSGGGAAATTKATTKSAASQMDGLLSTTFADSLATAPLAASAGSGVYVNAAFDFFGQSGSQSMPIQNLGYTVIWIDKSVKAKYFSGVASEKAPKVYVWDKHDQALNGEWPGNSALRVRDTDYYYVVVPESAYACIICHPNSTKTSATKLGGDSNGHIYLDNVCGVITSGNTFKKPAKCILSTQSWCCPYMQIDASVMDGSYKFTKYGVRFATGICYYDDYAPSAPATNQIGGKWYYYHRAKYCNKPIEYQYELPVIDKDSFTGKDLKLAFVGGNKIRMVNESYYYTYGTLALSGYSSINSLKENSLHNKSLSYDQPFGGANGARGNDDSFGRIGDTRLILTFDWYERKIPVDATDMYTFEIYGMKASDAFFKRINDKRAAEGKPEQKWWDDDYQTDDVYTTVIPNVYGEIWLTVNDIVTLDKDHDYRYSNMTLYTQSPEEIQVEDDQTIYFRNPGGWTDIKVTASGVGGSTLPTPFSYDSSTGLYYVNVKSKQPFLIITATDSSGQPFTARTSLQGNDMVLFDPTFKANTGGWDYYVPRSVEAERELYALHGIYYGSVLVKEYKSDGTPKSISGGSYDYAAAIARRFMNGNSPGQNCYTEGYVNSTGRSLDPDYIKKWTNAYTTLYAKMAKARAYIDKGRHYPEYLHNTAPDIYDSATLDALTATYDKAEALYKCEVSNDPDDAGLSYGQKLEKMPDRLLEMAKTLENAIDSVSISIENMIPVIFFDTRGLTDMNSSFELQYYLNPEGTGSPIKEEVKYRNTEGQPIIFVNHQQIYHVKFIINGVTETTEKDKMSILNGAWVYMDIPTHPYWVENSATDYQAISVDTFTEPASETLKKLYPLTFERTDISQPAPKPQTIDQAKTVNYRPVTFYFQKDCKVQLKDGTSYMIPAGAYSFVQKQFNGTTGVNRTPIIFTKIGKTTISNPSGGSSVVDLYGAALDLCTPTAKAYFEDPSSYYEYTDPDGSTDTIKSGLELNWVQQDGSKLIIAPGAHNTSCTVNMTANNGAFSATRSWNYLTTGRFYFRWMGNKDLYVENTVRISAKEIVFATSGRVNVLKNYNKHIYLSGRGNAESMNITFPTDVHVVYYDKYKIKHDFTIREGKYVIHKADPSQDYIADLCDEDYWVTMENIDIANEFSTSSGQLSGTGINSRLGRGQYSYD